MKPPRESPSGRVETPPTPEDMRAVAEEAKEAFPAPDNETRLTLLDVDPKRLHAYWNVTPATLHQARAGDAEPPTLAVRFHDVSPHGDGPVERPRPFDVVVQGLRNNCYVDLWLEGRSYVADLGLVRSDGVFTRLARSNRIELPASGQAPDIPRGEIETRVVKGVELATGPADQTRAPSLGGDAEAPPEPQQTEANPPDLPGLDRGSAVAAVPIGPSDMPVPAVPLPQPSAEAPPEPTMHDAFPPPVGPPRLDRPWTPSGGEAAAVEALIPELAATVLHPVGSPDAAPVPVAQDPDLPPPPTPAQDPDWFPIASIADIPRAADAVPVDESAAVAATEVALPDPTAIGGAASPAESAGPPGAVPTETRGDPGPAPEPAVPMESVLTQSSFTLGREDVELEINAELHIYGRTRPGRHLTLYGRPVQLRPDGTFSIRKPLPQGALVLPLILSGLTGEDDDGGEAGGGTPS